MRRMECLLPLPGFEFVLLHARVMHCPTQPVSSKQGRTCSVCRNWPLASTMTLGWQRATVTCAHPVRPSPVAMRIRHAAHPVCACHVGCAKLLDSKRPVRHASAVANIPWRASLGRAPAALRHAIQLHERRAGDVVDDKVYSAQLKGKAVATCLHKGLLQAPYFAERVLLRRWWRRLFQMGKHESASTSQQCAHPHNRRPGCAPPLAA